MKIDTYDFSYKELFDLAIEHPEMAQLELTRNCNQKCFFCFRACTPTERYKDLDLKTWEKIITDLYALGVRQLYFSGGEIFLYKDVELLFEFSKNIGIKFNAVNTNGVIELNKNKLSNVDELIFSIHGINEEHNQTTGLAKSFDRVEKNLQIAFDLVPKIGINTVVTERNIKNLDSIKNYFSKYPVAYHAFNLGVDQKALSTKPNSFDALISSYLAFLQTIPLQKLKLRHGMQNIFRNDACFFDAAIPLPHCAAGKYKLVVDYKADVYPCRYFQNNDFLCGNMLKTDIISIWKNGKGFKPFRSIAKNQSWPKNCSNCLKRFKCLGGCLAWRKLSNNNEYEKDYRCTIGNAHLGG
ncbi:MAG: radical SAM protein [Patescibacteria group bacterium]|nr:radical SAM protein [Patescibacteria group bacterium]